MFEVELGHYLTYHHVTQSFFRKHRDKFDGLIIPLSVATVFRQGTGGFVLTLKKQYALDPRTPLFQAEFDRSHIRRAHKEMASVHGPAIEAVFGSRPLQPSDLGAAEIRDVAQRVLTFQKEFAQQSAAKVQKYAALLGENVEAAYGGPHFLIPPYFKFGSRADPWYRISLEVAQVAANEKTDYRLAPVIHIRPDFPEGQLDGVASDYSSPIFDGFIVFVNDLQEYQADRSILTKYVKLVLALRQNRRPMLGLFGGYFTLVLRKIDLGCFSNAVGYGEYRDSGYHEGGQAVRRYYVPKLHRYFTDIEAQSILDIVNEQWFRCGCGVCAGRRRIANLTTDQLLDHFLNVRKQELEHAGRTDLRTILDELEETPGRLAGNRSIPADRYGHLTEWVAALRPFS